MKEWYQMSEQEAMELLQAKREGQTGEEAEAKLAKAGENVLQEGKKKSALRVFAEQFGDFLVIILMVAAVVSVASGNGESALVILAVLVMNAILGTVQHQKAEKSLESLRALSSPAARVLRDGQKVEIEARLVVPGDILLLEAGDLVAADGLVLESHLLQVNESSLTGETTGVEKREGRLEGMVPLAERTNQVFAGSLVTCGRGVVLVTGTGMHTEIGKIAGLMHETGERKTPLQVSLDDFSKKLAMLILLICAVVFGLCLYRKMALMDALLFAVALAVAAIPEALSSIVTIVQAMGTRKMAQENAIIKDLKAVESLGCVSVICSDKTGTLTQNKMTVQHISIGGETFTPAELDVHNQLHRYLLYDAILTNDAVLVDGKGIGDPTEYALLEMAEQAGIREADIRKLMPRLEELPFDSDRKLMSTKYQIHGISTVLTKGAVDVLLNRCTKIREGEDLHSVRPLTAEDCRRILEENDRFSKEGLRVLAFGYKEVQAEERLTKEQEKDFVFLGLVSMMDPPREESAAAVAEAIRAGIRPVMITGDHKVTAQAIAKTIGIYREGDLALTGMELDAMTEEELEQSIDRISVYARVSPEHKLRIVDAWQRRGNIVAMTGDGVNDAPALKKADIGVAMGITGTEVSKDAAAMILADDHFSTIINAVANGRCVYRNIRNAVQFLLSGNMAGIFCVLYTSLAGLSVPFQPVQLLFINLVTDSLPALAIGMEPAEEDLLSLPPRDPGQGILTGDFLRKILIQGAGIALCTMVAYALGLNAGGAALASTMAFSTLTLARLFHGFNCRSDHSILQIGFRRNPYSLGAFAAGVLLLGMVLLLAPLGKLFQVTVPGPGLLGAILLLAALPSLLLQVKRVIQEHV